MRRLIKDILKSKNAYSAYKFSGIYIITMLSHYISDESSFKNLLMKIERAETLIEKIGNTIFDRQNFASIVLLYLCFYYTKKLIDQHKNKNNE